MDENVAATHTPNAQHAPGEDHAQARRPRIGLIALAAVGVACVGVLGTTVTAQLVGSGLANAANAQQTASSSYLSGGGSGSGGSGSGASGSNGGGSASGGNGGSGNGGSGNGGSGSGSYGYGYGDGTGSSDGAEASSAQKAGIVDVTTQLQYQGAEAAGTGMVLTSNGEILTNNHVVEGATTITITVVSTGASYSASVVGTDATDDVALLKLSDASGMKTAALDTDGAGASVGNAVTAVGNAGGTGTLVAASGSVTASDQTITTQAEESVASETLNGLIQTDADIQAGDSGGPLYDASGEIVGMDTAAETGGSSDGSSGSSGSSTVAGYAIPIENALTIARQIASGSASSSITIGNPAFLGVEVVPASEGVDGSMGTTGTVSGASVAQVVDGTPAADAGLQSGDVITSVNGRAIGSSSDLTAALATLKPGASATIGWADATGASHTATVTLGSGPAA